MSVKCSKFSALSGMSTVTSENNFCTVLKLAFFSKLIMHLAMIMKKSPLVKIFPLIIFHIFSMITMINCIKPISIGINWFKTEVFCFYHGFFNVIPSPRGNRISTFQTVPSET